MGTRSVVAEQTGDGWRGRYVHWDGYPSGVGNALWRLVRRDGLATVRQRTMHDYHGWSTLIAATPEADGYSEPPRFVRVDGYGVAYSHAEQPDEWVTGTGDSWGAEFAYVLGDERMTILRNDYGPGTWSIIAQVTYAGAEPDWEEAEQA